MRIRIAATIIVITLSALGAPASGDAATRHASPGGAPVAGPCSAAAPCSLATAVYHAADGDRVVVAGGSYTIDAPLSVEDRRLEIVAASATDRPLITSTVAGGEATLQVGAGSLVRGLDVVQAGSGGYALHAGGVVERLRVRLTAEFARGIRTGADTTVRDTAVWGALRQQDGVIADAAAAGGPAELRLRNVTVVLDGASSQALEVRAGRGRPAHVDARSVILRGAGGDAELRGLGDDAATLTATDSLVRADEVAPVSGGLLAGAGMSDDEPLFADRAAGDLRPAAGSPSVDAGSADVHTGGADAAGLPRVQGAGIDIGAHEHVVPPPVRIVDVADVTTDGLRATGEIEPGPWRLSARWRLEVHGPAGLVAAGPWTLTLFGSRQTRAFTDLASDTEYVVRAVATGGFGEAAADATARTRAADDAGAGPAEPMPVPAAPVPDAAPVAPPAAAPVPDTGSTPAPQPARRDRTAPKVRVGWRGRAMRLTLSEPARVTLRLRTRGGRVLRSRTLRLPRGTTTVRRPALGRGVCSVRVTVTDRAGNRATRTFRRCR